jgi:hypothetical protein
MPSNETVRLMRQERERLAKEIQAIDAYLGLNGQERPTLEAPTRRYKRHTAKRIGGGHMKGKVIPGSMSDQIATLLSTDGPLTRGEIKEKLGIEDSRMQAISSTIHRLREMGLITHNGNMQWAYTGKTILRANSSRMVVES